jgi:hypothetical protein
MTAPDFITATFDNWRNPNAGSAYRNDAGKTRYVRRDPAVMADLPEAKAMVAAAVRDALERAASLPIPIIPHNPALKSMMDTLLAYQEAIRALIPGAPE